MSPVIIITYLLGLFVLYIFCRIFIRPLKWLARLALSCAVGCLAMLAANKLLGAFGAEFSINPLTAMISGVLGLPGMVMTLVLRSLL